jgi:hypothetical protein
MRKHLITIMLTFAALSAVGSTAGPLWQVLRTDIRLSRDVLAYRNARPAAVVNSAILRPQWYTTASWESIFAASPPAPFTLVFVQKQQCQWCPEALIRWRTLGERTSLKLVVIDAESDGDSPSSHGAATLRVSDIHRFSVATGVRGVPFALLFEGDSIVRAAVMGVPSAPTEAAVENIVSGRMDAPRVYNQHSAQSELLIPATPRTEDLASLE